MRKIATKDATTASSPSPLVQRLTLKWLCAQSWHVDAFARWEQSRGTNLFSNVGKALAHSCQNSVRCSRFALKRFITDFPRIASTHIRFGLSVSVRHTNGLYFVVLFLLHVFQQMTRSQLKTALLPLLPCDPDCCEGSRRSPTTSVNNFESWR